MTHAPHRQSIYPFFLSLTRVVNLSSRQHIDHKSAKMARMHKFQYNRQQSSLISHPYLVATWPHLRPSLVANGVCRATQLEFLLLDAAAYNQSMNKAWHRLTYLGSATDEPRHRTCRASVPQPMPIMLHGAQPTNHPFHPLMLGYMYLYLLHH